jgi:poly(3-hydroxybutyrate) depolymerase
MLFPHSAIPVFVISSLVALGSAAKSAGCGKELPAGQTPPGGDSHQVPFTTTALPHNRTYLVHIPSNYDKNKAVPLIFSFHGHGKTSKGQETLSQFSNESWNPNGIAVYPQGTLNDDGEVSVPEKLP